MRTRLAFFAAVFALHGCTIEEGNFDGSFFDDGSFRDSGDTEDSGANEDDSGAPPKDSGLLDSGTDSGTDSGNPSELTPNDVPGVLAAGRCGALETCLGKALLLATYEGNDCVPFLTRQLADRDLHWLKKSVDAGRVTFRADRLATCRNDLVALGCGVVGSAPPASCEEAVQGKAAVDATCTIDQDCAGNAYCDKGTLETCPGQCAMPQTEGLPCAATAECASGLLCRSGSCTPPLSEGDSCNTRFGSECPPGLICQGATGMLKCQSRQTVYAGVAGDDCDEAGKLCKEGLVCALTSGTKGTCESPAAASGACKTAVPSQCVSTQYCEDARTSVTRPVEVGRAGACVDRPTEGQACTYAGTTAPNCSPGWACVGDTPKCRALKVAGGDCLANAECYGGSCFAGTCEVTTIECQ